MGEHEHANTIRSISAVLALRQRCPAGHHYYCSLCLGEAWRVDLFRLLWIAIVRHF